MARMIPPTPDRDTPASERYVFGRLRDGLPGPYTVLHACRFVPPAAAVGRGRQEGELDFLVIDPARGMLGLEVKGGGVSRDTAGWRSTGSAGKTHAIKDPGRQAQGFTAESFHGFCRLLSERAGIEFRIPDQPKAQQRFWDSEAPEKLLEALARLPDERWDALIIDEGQDFRAHWWPAIEALLREPGKGALSVFFDPHQNIYGGGPPEDLAVHPHVLSWNCRNTAQIARWCAKQVGTDTELHPDAPEGEPVEEISCPTDAAVVDAIRTLLHRYVAGGRLSTDRIVVLSTHNPTRSVLSQHRKLAGFTLVSPEEEREPNHVRFMSLQRFKGLEADVVILVDVEPGKRTSGPMYLYVGASRARHRLAVVVNESGAA